jgi:hypothetical protein
VNGPVIQHVSHFVVEFLRDALAPAPETNLTAEEVRRLSLWKARYIGGQRFTDGCLFALYLRQTGRISEDA